MKPLFTVHAGEYLVGSHVERHFPRCRVWIPSKDTGIDLLVTDDRCRKTVSLQVKFSKDFNPTHQPLLVQKGLLAAGWWTLDAGKVRKSSADLWVFVLPSFLERKTSFIILTPAELLRRLKAIHGGQAKRLHSYLWVTKTKRCWEARGLNKADQELLAQDRYGDEDRDFTVFLDAWEEVQTGLR